MNAMSLGMTSAAARQRMSCSLEPTSALVGILAFSTAAAVLTNAAAMFLRMLSLVIVSNGMMHRMLSPAVNPPPIRIRINGRVKCRSQKTNSSCSCIQLSNDKTASLGAGASDPQSAWCFHSCASSNACCSAACSVGCIPTTLPLESTTVQCLIIDMMLSW